MRRPDRRTTFGTDIGRCAKVIAAVRALALLRAKLAPAFSESWNDSEAHRRKDQRRWYEKQIRHVDAVNPDILLVRQHDIDTEGQPPNVKDQRPRRSRGETYLHIEVFLGGIDADPL